MAMVLQNMWRIWLTGAVLAAAPTAAVAAEPLGQPRDPAPGSIAIAAADPFSALVGKGRGGDAGRGGVQRYAIASDGRMFLVEGKIGRARLKYLCGENDARLDCALDPEAYAEEVFLATGQRGPRGDVIYKGENGDVLLRIMSYGGATVFWPGRTNGEAASKTYGDGGVLDLPPANRQDAERRAALAGAKFAALTGEAIAFDAGLEAPGDAADAAAHPAAVLADAIVRVAAGMADVADDETGARVLKDRIDRVRFETGPAPRLAIDGATLLVVYDPGADAAGRPSSRAVREFLENSL